MVPDWAGDSIVGQVSAIKNEISNLQSKLVDYTLAVGGY